MNILRCEYLFERPRSQVSIPFGNKISLYILDIRNGKVCAMKSQFHSVIGETSLRYAQRSNSGGKLSKCELGERLVHA